MEIEISERMRGMSPSAIREMLKLSGDMVAFSAGNPSPDTFPAKEMAKIAAELFENEYQTALQYSITEGYGPLREQIRFRLLEKHGVGLDSDEIIIVSGGQQGIDLAAKCLTNEGDAVICENPSFVGALNDFRSYNLNLIGIDMDGEGMEPSSLEQALQSEKRVKLIYTIPSFQNPTGVTMSRRRREQLYELAVKYNVMILEDSPYFELRYSGEDIPCIKTLDKTGHVLFVGSFSKIISPGIRIGYVCGDRELVSKMTVAKQGQDVHTNLFFMMLVSRFIERYDLDGHISKCREIYRKKRDLLLTALDRHMDSRVSYKRPDGGLFIWCSLPEGVSGKDFCAFAAKEYGVAAVPGVTFDADSDPDNPGFRINFSTLSDGLLVEGAELLGKAAKAFLK